MTTGLFYPAALGETIESDITVEKKLYFFSDWGPVTMYVMSDQYDHQFIWNSNGKTKLTEGEKYRIRGKIRQFKIYKDKRQTVLTYVKVVNDE